MCRKNTPAPSEISFSSYKGNSKARLCLWRPPLVDRQRACWAFGKGRQQSRQKRFYLQASKAGECAHRGIADGAFDWIEYAVQGPRCGDSIHRASGEVTLLQSLIFRMKIVPHKANRDLPDDRQTPSATCDEN